MADYISSLTNEQIEQELTLNGLVAGSSLADADTFRFYDASLSASPKTRKISWTNFKSNLKLYFDTVYSAAGAYFKPTGGIPKTDLAAGVQTSLGKADSALQTVPATYRTAAEQDIIDAEQDSALEFTEKKLKYLSELTKGQAWDTDTDSSKNRIKTVPAGAKAAAIIMIAGESRQINSLIYDADTVRVDSKKSDDTLLDSFEIPAALRTAYPLRSADAAYDEYDFQAKTFTRRIASVNMGSLTWTYDSTNARFFAYLPARKIEVGNLLSPIYTCYPNSSLNDLPNMGMRGQADGSHVFVKNTAYTDAAAFKTAMSGKTLYYQLAAADEPVDISGYIGDDNLITVEAGGKLNFVQSNTAISMVNTVEYAINLSEATA